MTSVDWNPFLGTITQAGAAFVSIVGGFLAARIIQFGTDRGVAVARIASLRDRRDRLVNARESKLERLTLYHASGILGRLIGKLPASVGEVVARSDLKGSASSYLDAYPIASTEIDGDASALAGRLVDLVDRSYAEVSEFVMQNPSIVLIDEFRSAFRPMLSAIEDKVYIEVFCKLRGYGTILGGLPAYFQQHVAPEYPPEWIIDTGSDYRSLSETWRDEGIELDAVKREIAAEQNSFSAAARPMGVRGAIGILVPSTVFSVIVPLAYMTRQPEVDLSRRVIECLPGLSHVNLLVVLLASVLLTFVWYLLRLQRRFSKVAASNGDADPWESGHSARTCQDRLFAKPLAGRPGPVGGQMLNAFGGYLQSRGASVTFTGESDAIAILDWNGESREFIGDAELDAIRKAYEYVYDRSGASAG